MAPRKTFENGFKVIKVSVEEDEYLYVLGQAEMQGASSMSQLVRWWIRAEMRKSQETIPVWEDHEVEVGPQKPVRLPMQLNKLHIPLQDTDTFKQKRSEDTCVHGTKTGKLCLQCVGMK